MNIEVIPAWWGSLRRCTVHCEKDHPRELATGQTWNGDCGRSVYNRGDREDNSSSLRRPRQFARPRIGESYVCSGECRTVIRTSCNVHRSKWGESARESVGECTVAVHFEGEIARARDGKPPKTDREARAIDRK